jgi:hypothetical protein
MTNDFGAEEVAELVEEARRQSRRQAVEIISARLTAFLVDSMDRLLGSTSGRPEESAEVIPISDAPGSRSGWYVYGITWESAARKLEGASGVEDAAIQVVTGGDLAAVVSPLSASAQWGVDAAGEVDLDRLAPRARRHEWVLEQMLEEGAVLPLRFGVMYPDLDRLRRSLGARASELASALRRLENQREWGLTVEAGDQPVTASTGPVTAAAGPASSGRGYLAGRRVEREAAEARDEELARVADGIHRALCGVAADAVVHAPASLPDRRARVVLRASYLVPAPSEAEFRQRAEAALKGARSDLRLVGDLTGPWPPYHFCDVSLEEVPA